ncbi:MAG: ATP-binding protein [Daejeonella sp.]|uniref:ATP-binding protein n=1 Tax=Daejeonella sp. TaxID=2805397 RepID=UPI0027326656|nr:ATP-binding protein [Daejeonella sp.]MDP3467425.1 ATP-binding protein [Daejeonella sp.]
MNFVNFFKNLNQSALKGVTDPIVRARINILFYMMSLTLVFGLILTIVYIIYGPPLQLIRIVVVMGTMIYGFRKLILFNDYRPSAHIVLIIINMLVWSNIFLIANAISIVTVQYILLSSTISFFFLNGRWGIFYSLLSLFPVFIYFSLNGINDSAAFISGQQASEPIFIAVMMFNFFQLIFINYHFITGFYLALSQLEEARKDEKELNEQLREAISMAENSSKAKSDFLSTMSHELRTPLNSVIGMSYVLLADNPREDQAGNLKVLHFSAESLLALINDILDFNKLDYGKIEMEKVGFYPAELLGRIHSGLKYQADEKGLSFSLNLDDKLKEIAVIGDPTRLLQILFNLVGNAIKFTSKGEIGLSVQLIDSDNEYVTLAFTVMDTGIGISAEQKKIIFEPFTQASSNITRKFGGSGLGLAITKQLLEIHGSHIELKSEVGEGTTFKFEIRYKCAGSAEITVNSLLEANVLASEDITWLNVLVAEDNAMNILLMKKLLASWNVKAEFAPNGLEAYEMAKEKFYDIILMDIHMPVMDGYESTKKIIAFYADKPEAPYLIALTASVANDIYNKIKLAGLNDYVSKPFNPTELKSKLINFSRLKSKQD